MTNSLEIFSWFEHLYIVVVLVFVTGILASGKKSGSIMAWIFAVLFLPIIGIVLYMVLGINWRRRRILKNKMENSPHKMFVSLSNELAKNELSKYDTRDIFSSYKENIERTDKYMRGMEDHSDVAKLLYNTGSTYLTLNTSYDFYFDGREAFDSIIKDLENAKESIY
ncbi:MAG: PLDc N-terminal domain-containing protein, partial [Fusobacteriales bacterium]|nr:PLDc N-terminal domain-containing protein [Fusobacteriales bacterium]